MQQLAQGISIQDEAFMQTNDVSTLKRLGHQTESRSRHLVGGRNDVGGGSSRWHIGPFPSVERPSPVTPESLPQS